MGYKERHGGKLGYSEYALNQALHSLFPATEPAHKNASSLPDTFFTSPLNDSVLEFE